MSKTINKITELEYNETIALAVIEADEDLNKIFTDDVKIPFNLLYKLSTDNKLHAETSALIKSLFDHVILTKKSLINKYKILAAIPVEIEDNEGNFEHLLLEEESIGTGVVEIKTEKVADTFAVSKPKKERAIPRRYGKEKILKDIESQGGKMTPVQNAMLKVNSLKNIYVNLSARGIKDMLTGTQLLSDADCRDIVSVVTIAERKLEEILKRRK